MRNLQLVTKLCNKKTKDVCINIYKIHETHDGEKYIVRSIKDKFEKHRELPSLDEAKDGIEDREYQQLSSALAYIQDELYNYSKDFDVICTLMSSANKAANFLMRSDSHGTRDMIEIVSVMKEFFDSGVFQDVVKSVNKCFKF